MESSGQFQHDEIHGDATKKNSPLFCSCIVASQAFVSDVQLSGNNVYQS